VSFARGRRDNALLGARCGSTVMQADQRATGRFGLKPDKRVARGAPLARCSVVVAADV
jgi:hypothetical protein